MTLEDQIKAVDEAYLSHLKSLYEVAVCTASGEDEGIRSAMTRFHKGLLTARKVRTGILEILSQSMDIPT